VLFTEAMREWAESQALANISFDSNYQLNVEDALDISKMDVVIFADACKDQSAGFVLRPVKPSKNIPFSTHALDPESVLPVCEELFGKKPEAYILTIKGYAWELTAEPTPRAMKNLASALKHLKGLLKAV
jgi:hypothetical protein